MAEAPPNPPPLTPSTKALLDPPTESATPSGVKPEPPPSATPGPDDSAASPPPEIVSYTVTIPSCSAWFSMDSIHDTERRLLPEFFPSTSNPNPNQSSPRNPSSYKQIRNAILFLFHSNPTKKLTFTEARKTLTADVGSVRRVFDFLEEWGLVNYQLQVRKLRDKREEEMERKEEGMIKRVCTGCLAVCSLACFTTDKQADITLCARCFVRSNYQRPGLSSADFRRVDLSDGPKSDWSDKETLHLLEAVLHYGEDWRKVAEFVASRGEKDCIARFVRLRFGEQFLGEGRNGNFDQDEEESAKRRKLSPLADASNPIMAQVAFLTAIVGPRVSEAAARAAVNALSDYDYGNINLKDEKEDLVKKAELEIEKEQQDVERSLSEIVEIQMKEIKNKIEKFEEMEFLMEKEKLQVESIKDLVLVDQLALAQNQQKGKGEKIDNVTWHKLEPLVNVMDKGTTILL